MKLIDHLNSVMSDNNSYVQAYLAKEDLTRVEKLRALAKSAADAKAMEKDGPLHWLDQGRYAHP